MPTTLPSNEARSMTTTHDRTRRDLEAMVGVDSAEVLLDQRRTLMVELAPLRARYGSGGTWDARRKAHRSAVQNEIADRLTRETGKKPAEAESERLAAADPRVLVQLDEAEESMARLHILTDEVEAITELLMRDQALIKFACFEPR